MTCAVVLKPRAERDLKSLSPDDARRVLLRLRTLENNLAGDVKKLSNFTPSYRMRAGDWRALFEVEDGRVVIYRILHRRESYR
ncbi:MAG: type II toxin-antitoxin system RelE/ParE family toxin [Opitutales bacterium]|jgi:mRNA interferase RelE/StbE